MNQNFDYPPTDIIIANNKKDVVQNAIILVTVQQQSGFEASCQGNL